MSVEGFDSIISQSFPLHRPPTEATQALFDAVLQKLPAPVTVVDNEMVRSVFDSTQGEIEVIVHAEKVMSPATDEVMTDDEILVDFTYGEEGFELSASDLDEDVETYEMERVTRKWERLLVDLDDADRAWLEKAWFGLHVGAAFRPFLVRELLYDSAVELSICQMWSGGYKFSNGTHIAIAAEVPVGTYPPIPDSIEPIELEIATTLPNRMQYVYQRSNDGEEQLVCLPDIRKYIRDVNTVDTFQDEPEVSIVDATVLLEAELASDRARPTDRLMRRMTKVIQKALASELYATGPMDEQLFLD